MLSTSRQGWWVQCRPISMLEYVCVLTHYSTATSLCICTQNLLYKSLYKLASVQQCQVTLDLADSCQLKWQESILRCFNDHLKCARIVSSLNQIWKTLIYSSCVYFCWMFCKSPSQDIYILNIVLFQCREVLMIAFRACDSLL